MKKEYSDLESNETLFEKYIFTPDIKIFNATFIDKTKFENSYELTRELDNKEKLNLNNLEIENFNYLNDSGIDFRILLSDKLIWDDSYTYTPLTKKLECDNKLTLFNKNFNVYSFIKNFDIDFKDQDDYYIICSGDNYNYLNRFFSDSLHNISSNIIAIGQFDKNSDWVSPRNSIELERDRKDSIIPYSFCFLIPKDFMKLTWGNSFYSCEESDKGVKEAFYLSFNLEFNESENYKKYSYGFVNFANCNNETI